MCIHAYTLCVCVCVCVYIYIYIYTILYEYYVYAVRYYTSASFTTNSMHPGNWVLWEKLVVFQMIKKFPLFHDIPKFITAFIVRPPLVHVLSQIIPIHHPYTAFLFSPRGLFPSGLPIKTLHAPLLSPYLLHAPPISFFFIWSPK